MSNNSIFDKGWIDLVFEGRNKAYGAYRLREESGKDTLMALFSGIGLIGLVGGGLSLISSFSNPAIADVPEHSSPTIYISPIGPVNPPKPNDPMPPAPKSQPSEPVETKVLSRPTVVHATDNPEENLVTANPTQTSNERPEPDAGTGGANGSEGGVTGGTGTTTATGTGTTPDVPDNGLVVSAVLDRQPQFPGGMKAFYERVIRDFRAPVGMNGESGDLVKVMVQFVVETNGTLTDVRVIKRPGTDKDVSREAERVLRNMNVRWEPGIYKGQKVRTNYTLPITVAVP